MMPPVSAQPMPAQTPGMMPPQAQAPQMPPMVAQALQAALGQFSPPPSLAGVAPGQAPELAAAPGMAPAMQGQNNLASVISALGGKAQPPMMPMAAMAGRPMV